MTTLNTLKENAIANNLNKEVKMYNLLDKLLNEDVVIEELQNKKNNSIEYLFTIDDNYSILYQPLRNEAILKYNNNNYMEIYTNKEGYSICTRGYYLLKTIFKDTKKDNAIKNILVSALSYHPKFDMKHVFKNITIDVAISLIKKFYHLNYNSNLTENAFVNKDEDLGSKKSIYLVNRDEEEEEEE